MVTVDDAGRIALALPKMTQGERHGNRTVADLLTRPHLSARRQAT